MELNRLFALGIAFAAATGALAQERFSQVIGPDELASAGLSKLTPAELARLDQLVESYKSGALEAARREASAASAAQAAAEARAKAAEVDAQAAREAQAAAEREKAKAVEQSKAEAKASGGFFARAKALVAPGTKIEYEPIESRIYGDVLGWDSQTTFTLENGQRWQVANFTHYFHGKAVKNPAVTILPSGVFGGFDMKIEGIGTVRVRLVGEGILNPASPPAPSGK